MSAYRNQFSNASRGEKFEIIVDDDTMAWTTEPPGGNVDRTYTMPFTGSDAQEIKTYVVFPGGRAQRLGD